MVQCAIPWRTIGARRSKALPARTDWHASCFNRFRNPEGRPLRDGIAGNGIHHT